MSDVDCSAPGATESQQVAQVAPLEGQHEHAEGRPDGEDVHHHGHEREHERSRHGEEHHQAR